MLEQPEQPYKKIPFNSPWVRMTYVYEQGLKGEWTYEWSENQIDIHNFTHLIIDV